MTRLPVEVWFHTNPKANDTNFETDLLSLVTAKTLLLLDRGFYHFDFFAQLINQQVDFIRGRYSVADTRGVRRESRVLGASALLTERLSSPETSFSPSSHKRVTDEWH